MNNIDDLMERIRKGMNPSKLTLEEIENLKQKFEEEIDENIKSLEELTAQIRFERMKLENMKI